MTEQTKESKNKEGKREKKNVLLYVLRAKLRGKSLCRHQKERKSLWLDIVNVLFFLTKKMADKGRIYPDAVLLRTRNYNIYYVNRPELQQKHYQQAATREREKI